MIKLVLFINKKSHMGFRLVPKSVTLNDLERGNDLYFAPYAKSVRFKVNCVKLVVSS